MVPIGPKLRCSAEATRTQHVLQMGAESPSNRVGKCNPKTGRGSENKLEEARYLAVRQECGIGESPANWRLGHSEKEHEKHVLIDKAGTPLKDHKDGE